MRINALAALLFAGCASCGASPGPVSTGPTASTEQATTPATGDAEPLELGSAATCEPSAAVVAPWDPTTVLVADNEVDDLLFAYTRSGTRLIDPRPFPLGGRRTPHDIEAITALPDASLLLVGSHSRKRDCSEAEARRRLRWVDRSGAELAHADEFTLGADASACVTNLFAAPIPEHAQALCELLVTRDTRADCAGGLDIEGAVTANQRVWFGLRAPLIEGRAVLLRLVQTRGQTRFDGLVLLDLGGRGVRELARREDPASGGVHIYGIAGPSGEDSGIFELFSIDPSLSRAPIMLHVLPPNSEGLVVEERDGQLGAQVVIDGARGTDAACTVPGRQLWVPLATSEQAGGPAAI